MTIVMLVTAIAILFGSPTMAQAHAGAGTRGTANASIGPHRFTDLILYPGVSSPKSSYTAIWAKGPSLTEAMPEIMADLQFTGSTTWNCTLFFNAPNEGKLRACTLIANASGKKGFELSARRFLRDWTLSPPPDRKDYSGPVTVNVIYTRSKDGLPTPSCPPGVCIP